MKNILIAMTFIIFCGTGLAQNIRTTKEVNEMLHCQNFSVTTLNNFHTTLYSKDWKNGWNQHPNRKIIGGSIFILLGAEGIIEAFISSTNNYNDPNNSRITQIGMTSISVMLLSSGTVFLIRGINLKRQNKLKVTTSKNGIGLIYRI